MNVKSLSSTMHSSSEVQSLRAEIGVCNGGEASQVVDDACRSIDKGERRVSDTTERVFQHLGGRGVVCLQM